MIRIIGLTVTLLFSAICLSGENETQEVYGKLISSIKNELLDGFVLPEVAPKYAERLQRCLTDNCLAKMSKAEAASAITELLQDVYMDKHLRIFEHEYQRVNRGARQTPRRYENAAQVQKTGIVDVSVLDGNIGYMEMVEFPGTRASLKATREAMEQFLTVDAVIFDIRQHRGGSPENISEITRFLFTEPTHMVTTQSPHFNSGQPSPHVTEPNKHATAFSKKPVYLLISENSASAAEHFAMSMKSTGRAILVGETTGGYGHWGDTVRLPDGFSMFVPSGRTYHPKTKLGWEGIGVTPDIMVTTEDSLDYTVKRIRSLQG